MTKNLLIENLLLLLILIIFYVNEPEKDSKKKLCLILDIFFSQETFSKTSREAQFIWKAINNKAFVQRS